MSSTYDALIIGGGPAGLTAALTLARQQHTSVVFDAGSYRNDATDHMHLLPGFDHAAPAEFRSKARENITSRYDQVSIQNIGVKQIRKTDGTGRFELVDANDKTWTGKKVILASGVEDIFPDLEGYADFWGKGIFHCLFCKGYEQRGCPSAGLLATEGLANVPFALHVARQVAALSSNVTLYTNGSEELSTNLQSAFGSAKQMRVDSRRIKRFNKGTGSPAEVTIEFEDGTHAVEGFLAHHPRSKPKGPFCENLGLEKTPSGDLKAGPPFYETSVKGVFAAGDNCSMMKNVPNAIFSGSLAAMGASSQILAEALGQKALF
ncbi:FAD/NAD(P)-binding domain-containing protein [Xylona heveae TC161]|uniref:FAD/NAD(P)-binding domain-containing protein n=1 Tax=Xylona heveae (strain CBS 132557 / TC161) TaxID=1328760 RepID=A0A161TDJ7_XYLHT|nr:FAD/NAD(P)-binding domain-containing protein [Xylona heveae TC161]KZF23927.1 FAD/NAD(P)-binding domain-containing protein [Xylona heveae TC161]